MFTLFYQYNVRYKNTTEKLYDRVGHTLEQGCRVLINCNNFKVFNYVSALVFKYIYLKNKQGFVV